MILYPAIDLYAGQAVRLEKGDYSRMTVYDPDPVSRAKSMRSDGADHLHLVDLEGARSGKTDNLPVIRRIAEETGLFLELGGGIRDLETAQKYLDIGVSRVILGTAAAEDDAFLQRALEAFGDAAAVGVDLLDGRVRTRGWEKDSAWTAEDFFDHLASLGVRTVICTDISRDGMLAGTNLELYARLNADYPMDLIASGGVSSLEDLCALKALGMAGAIVGKAYYTGNVTIPAALQALKE